MSASKSSSEFNVQAAQKSLSQKSELILNELKKLEPSDNEVFASEVHEVKIVFENKDFSISTSHSNTTFGIRCINAGRLGFVTTNATSDSALKEAAHEVQLVARMSPPSPHHQISKANHGATSFNSFDAKLAGLAPKEAFAFAQQMIDEALRDPRLSVDRAEFSISQQTWNVMNSNGVSRSAAATSSNWYAMGMAHTGGEVTSFDYDGGGVSSLSEIEPEIKRTIGQFRESVLGSIGAKPASTYKGPVLLHPYAALELIAGIITANCNGLRHQDGMSSWKGKVGEIVASKLISVIEDPQNQKRFEGWMPFDREGVMTAKHSLVNQGRLEFVAQNCFSAHRAGVQPTGNATGGARSLPGLGFTNLSLDVPIAQAGVVTDRELHEQMGRGLVLKRFSGNEDPVSGQFSGVAKNSWWLEKGERAFPVQEMMVAGNLFEVLNNVVAVGNVSHEVMGGGRAPYVLIDNLSVTAG